MRKKKYFVTVCLAWLLFTGAVVPAQAAVFCSDVRVLLSVGKQQSLPFTPVGAFKLKEDPSLVVGNEELQVKVSGGRVSVTLGGKTVTGASLTFLSGNYGAKTDYIRLKNAEYSTCTYLGNITFDVSEGAIRAINTLPIEQYLYGVVPHEMSNSFPLDALKAQAVCARGYAVARCSKYATRAYDLVDTSKDQVYRGYASKNTRAIAAVESTRGKVLTYEDDIIEAYYSASNGGQTEKTGNVWENDFAYYEHADDPFDLKNASSIEEKSFIPETFDAQTRKLMDPPVLLALERAAYQAAGRAVTLLGTVSVMPATPSYAEPSRCYTEANITLLVSYNENGKAQTGQVSVTLPLEELKFGSFENMIGNIGARQTRLRMRGAERGIARHGEQAYAGWFITERRYGHGVGLSQRGAQERARAGQPYTDILSFYYVNTTLNTIGTYATAPPIKSDTYKVREWGISGISIGTSAESLLRACASEAKLSLVNAKGAAAEGEVRTGYFLRATYESGLSFFDLPIVLFGDLDGDGKITEDDIAALQNHLVHAEPLTGARLSAADINHDGTVNIWDIHRLIQAVNSDAKISQGS